MLTIEAYNETPVSEHLFLPIVSLGDCKDKFIPWGETISDKHGNYYYTSFSPAGYFIPWFFMKIFQLSVCEKSLYIFNSLLFALSGALWAIFIYLIFKDNDDKIWLSFIGVVTYVLTPELLHGMGRVYWHQSLMQVTLLGQVMAFWQMKRSNSKYAKGIFYMLALVNPYIEWTGYVANVGFAITELMIGYKNNRKKAFGKAIKLGIVTIASFFIFVTHYLLRVDASALFMALKNRFMARNVTTSVELTSLFGSYLNSFLFLWFLIVVLIIWNIVKKQSIEIKYGFLLFTLAFPVIENIIMKQHAINYTYDKMKACFFLSLLACELAHQLLSSNKDRKTAIIISALVISIGMLNAHSYMNDADYTWSTSYRDENTQIASYVNQNYPDSVIGIENNAVRGYMNLLFGRGIYEYTNADTLKSIALDKNLQYAIVLNIEGNASGEVYDLGGAIVYDVLRNDVSIIFVNDGEIVMKKPEENRDLAYQLSSLTDQNWTDGYSNTANILLFEYNDELLTELLHSNNIVCDGNLFLIDDVDYDNEWIRVSVDSDASVCKYPNYIQIE